MEDLEWWLDTTMFAIIFGMITGIRARQKGYRFGRWFVYGLLIWPVALIHISLKEENLSNYRSNLGDVVDRGRPPPTRRQGPISS